MAPKAKAAAKAAKRSSYNERSLARRAAVGLLNDLAETVGVKKIPKKSTSGAVEAFVRRLEPRCQTSDLAGRLRAAAAEFLASGGVFDSAVLPVHGVDVPEAEADGDAPPALLRHRLLEPGFRLASKAFMLTFNSRTFSEATWPDFLNWMKQRRRDLGARRWGACLEVSENASVGTLVVCEHVFTERCVL